MIIVGIMGGISHGKTTFAKALRAVEPMSKHIESSELISEVVNVWQSNTSFIPCRTNPGDIQKWIRELQAVLSQICHQPVDPAVFDFNKKEVLNNPELYEKLHIYLDQISRNPGLLKTAITIHNKSDFRAILQWLGGFVQIKLRPGFWFTELVNRLQHFETEGIVMGILGGVRFPADVDVVKNAGGYIIDIERPLPRELDAYDLTELARKQIKPDAIIHNDAGIAELTACAQKVYLDLRVNNLMPSYFASKYDK